MMALGIAGACGIAAPILAAPEVKISLVPEAIGLEEAARLEVTIEGGGTQNLHFDVNFDLENFRRVGPPSQSTSIQILNGVPSSSRSLTWYLQPTVVGKASVRKIVVEVGNERLELGERTVEVQQEVPAERRREAQRQDPFASIFGQDPFEDFFGRRRQPVRRQAQMPKIFLRTEVEPRNPYVGQQVLYTLYLYTQTNIHSVNPEQLPDFKGFWVRDVPHPEQREPETVEVDGERMGRVILLQRALFPRREGPQDISAVKARLVARLPEPGPFGPAFARATEIERDGDPIRLEVKPLPPPPPGFSGAVGKLTLSAKLEPGEVAVGDATTLTLALEGRGSLQSIPEPRLPELAGLKLFPPQEQSNEELRGTTLWGNRQWSFVLVPERAGTYTLPAVEMPFFDPQTGRYEVAASPGLTLVVRGTTSQPRVGGENLELHPIRTAILPSSDGGGGWTAALPWLFVLPWGLALVVLGVRRRGQGNPARPARRRLLERLSAAAAEERPRQAAAEIEDAWREFLDTRWGIPPGTPSTQWARLLETKGRSAQAAQELVALADDLHYLRYAPKLSSTDDLRTELVERSRKLLKAVG